MIIHHNKKCEKLGTPVDCLSEKDIIGDIGAFQFAGLDTSLQASTSCICWLAKKYPEWIEKIKEDGLDNIDQILKNKSLDLVIKETLRLNGPIPGAFFRRVIKDMEITGVNVPKGTVIFLPMTLTKFHPHFINPTEFRPERFDEEVSKLQYGTYIPFYEGKRKCIGQN